MDEALAVGWSRAGLGAPGGFPCTSTLEGAEHLSGSAARPGSGRLTLLPLPQIGRGPTPSRAPYSSSRASFSACFAI